MDKIWVVVFVGALLVLTLVLDRFISRKNSDKNSADETENQKNPPDDEKNRF